MGASAAMDSSEGRRDRTDQFGRDRRASKSTFFSEGDDDEDRILRTVPGTRRDCHLARRAVNVAEGANQRRSKFSIMKPTVLLSNRYSFKKTFGV